MDHFFVFVDASGNLTIASLNSIDYDFHMSKEMALYPHLDYNHVVADTSIALLNAGYDLTRLRALSADEEPIQVGDYTMTKVFNAYGDRLRLYMGQNTHNIGPGIIKSTIHIGADAHEVRYLDGWFICPDANTRATQDSVWVGTFTKVLDMVRHFRSTL